MSANCRTTIPEKKAITSRACYFFKEMTVSCALLYPYIHICTGRLKSNFLFHKTIWRFLVCVCVCVCERVCTSWPGRWRIVTIAIILFFYFPRQNKTEKRVSGRPEPREKKNTVPTVLGHGPSNNSHNTTTLVRRSTTTTQDNSEMGLPIYF